MRKTLPLLMACVAPLQAAVIGINFGQNEQTEATGPYTSTALGVTVTNWNFQSASDWSGNGQSFSADGATLSIYHDASNTWRNADQPESSVLHGYLDDGPYTSGAAERATVQVGGLLQWLASTGDTAWRITVLMSSGDATAFSPVSLWESDDTTGWFQNPPLDEWPGTAGAPTASLTTTSTGDNVARHDETTVHVGTSDAFVIQTSRDGTIRGSVAGIIIESVPEPSAALLALLGMVPLVGRRQR